MCGFEQRPAVDDRTVSREHGRGENHAHRHLRDRDGVGGADDPSAWCQRPAQRGERDDGHDHEPGHVGETTGDGDAARAADDARADGQGADGDEADTGSAKGGRHGSCDGDRGTEEGEDRGDRCTRRAGEREVQRQPHAVRSAGGSASDAAASPSIAAATSTPPNVMRRSASRETPCGRFGWTDGGGPESMRRARSRSAAQAPQQAPSSRACAVTGSVLGAAAPIS